MSNDDAEIIPPRKGLPAKRPENTPASMNDVRRLDTGGIVGSTITRWTAKNQLRALDEIAKRYRSEADALKAYGEVADAFENTARKVNRLRHLPDTIALDDEKWRSGREEEYEDLNHRKEMNRRLRQREIEEADTEHVEARRQKFTAEQGYENQQRLKDRNLRLWEKRHEARELDAHVETERVRAELRGGDKPAEKSGSLESMRAKAEEALITALADGNDAEAERWQRVLDALGD
jgi:hypothetical protein